MATDLRDTPAMLYFDLRDSILNGTSREISVPPEAHPAFWAWYASRLRRPGEISVHTGSPVGLTFPEPTGELVLWRTPGMGTAYTEEKIRHLGVQVLTYGDVAHVVEPHRRAAPLIFVLAVLTAHAGYSFGYLGGVQSQPCGAPDRSGRIAPDEPDEFVEAWNEYHSSHRLRRLAGTVPRDLVLDSLPAETVSRVSSCDVQPGGWCRDCPRCFEAFYTAKAVGRPLGFKLTGRVFDELYVQQYRRYLDSEFCSDPTNALQVIVYLQMKYGLTFDRDTDTQ